MIHTVPKAFDEPTVSGFQRHATGTFLGELFSKSHLPEAMVDLRTGQVI